MSRATGSLLSTVDTTASLYRPDAKNISPLAFLGVEKPTEWLSAHEGEIRTLRSNLEKAGLSYQELDMIDHPKAREIAHIGRAISRISDIISHYLDSSDDFLALL